MTHYKKHLFFCINQRISGKTCCQNHGAQAMRAYAKERLKALNLWGPGKFRANTAGCMGRCKQGPTLAVYPDGVWYSYETQQDIDEIIQKHLVQGQIVTRLLMPKPQE